MPHKSTSLLVIRHLGRIILETVRTPDLVLKGHGKELLALKRYIAPLGPKDMVVIYREDKQLIITAFLTSKSSKLLSKRRTVWQKPRL
jgi:hypothetical protein